MNVWEQILGRKELKPMIDDNYWKKLHEEKMADKVIVTRYVALFGQGLYGNLCGVKEVEGFYDKTYPVDARVGEKHEKTVDIFSQVEPNSYTTYWHFDIKRVFETREAAQFYYERCVDSYIKPLQEKINRLAEGKSGYAPRVEKPVINSLKTMELYTINGSTRRILWIHKGQLQYDNGHYNDIPKLSSVYSFTCWLLTNSQKI